jgi:CubicO group peptidase (beta-lactamase class C family)
MRRVLTAAALLLLASPLSSLESRLSAQSLTARADSTFAGYNRADAPGCAVGVDSSGQPLYRGAYGMAELEFGSPMQVGTISEAGSVSKQFVAASIMLLAARGVLSLDDTLQQWFPEIPAYDHVITLRHLLHHSSGLRDWGSVAALAGWPRGERAHTQADALAIIARQRGLNHVPGAAFSYTNSGYNLLAILVERAAHVPFAEFTRREFFQPLGMAHTSWRDDFTRLVPGRAQAYAPAAGHWKLDMPFEDVHGNGGLLTTVGDLLIWTRALNEGRLGTPDVSAAMTTPGRFNDGSVMGYGGGLFIGAMRGVPAVSHTGATAGYRAVLATFTDQHLSVAILCNRADANPARLAEALLAGRVPFGPPPPRANQQPPATYPLDRARFADYTGQWHSDEADGTITIAVRDGGLMASRRPGQWGGIRATGPDRFAAPGGVSLRFERDSTGRTTRLFVSVSRALDVRFDRMD